jgi:hypothetical protein
MALCDLDLTEGDYCARRRIASNLCKILMEETAKLARSDELDCSNGGTTSGDCKKSMRNATLKV